MFNSLQQTVELAPEERKLNFDKCTLEERTFFINKTSRDGTELVLDGDSDSKIPPINSILTFLENNLGIHSLVICNSDSISSDDLRSLLRFLSRKKTGITSLNLSNQDLQNIDAFFDCLILISETLKVLILRNSGITDGKVAKLLEHFKDDKTLTALDVSDNAKTSGPVGWEHTADFLPEFLQVNHRLESLKFGCTYIGHSFDWLSSLAGNTALRVLDLRENTFHRGAQDTKALVEGLAANRSLEYLNLSGIGLNDADFAQLAAVLSTENETLCTLDVSKNGISAESQGILSQSRTKKQAIFLQSMNEILSASLCEVILSFRPFGNPLDVISSGCRMASALELAGAIGNEGGAADNGNRSLLFMQQPLVSRGSNNVPVTGSSETRALTQNGGEQASSSGCCQYLKKLFKK